MSTKILPVPRIDVDKLLAIEAAQRTEPSSVRSKPSVVTEKTEPSTVRSTSASLSHCSTVVVVVLLQTSFDPSKPLPPIPRSPSTCDDEEENEHDLTLDEMFEKKQEGDEFFMTAVRCYILYTEELS